MKKMLVSLLAAAVMMACGISAMAMEPRESRVEVDLSGQLIQCGGYPAVSEVAVQTYSMNWAGARAAIATGMKNRDTSIDISQYEIPTAQIGTLCTEVINENPGLFYVESSFSYSKTGTLVKTVYPSYSAAYTAADVTAYYNKVAEILSGVEEDWSDLQKALYLHDYLVSHAQYDYTYQRHDAYSLLMESRGVCQAYTLAYKELLNGADITNGTVSSKTRNHIWSLALIGGEWYHIDVTWDDPGNTAVEASPTTVPDRLGGVSHDYFLLTETEMRLDHNATDWSFLPETVSCDDTTYAEWHGRFVSTAFVPLGDSWYYIDTAESTKYALYQTADPASGGTALCTLDQRWRVWNKEDSVYADPYSALWEWNGTLVFSTPSTLRCYDPRTGRLSTLCTLDTTGGELYGFSLSGNEATCLLTQNPTSFAAWTLKSVTLYPYEQVDGGGYSVCQRDGTLYLRQDAADGCLILARYDKNDRMVEWKTIATQYGELSMTVPTDGSTLKAFALTAAFAPRCAARTWQGAA